MTEDEPAPQTGARPPADADQPARTPPADSRGAADPAAAYAGEPATAAETVTEVAPALAPSDGAGALDTAVVPTSDATELSDAEIAALLGGGGAVSSELSDDEISALLNGGFGADPGIDSRPVEQIIVDSVVSQNSSPMLTHVCDRLRGKLTISLRNHTSDNVEITDLLEILRYSDYVNRVPLPVMIGVAEAREWATPMMVLFDGALIYGLIELLMGGRKNVVSRPDQRQFTAIEQKMIERTMQITLDDLSAAFSSLAEVNFVLKHMEMNPRFAGLARDSDVIVLMRMKLQLERRSGCIDIVLPRASLEPIREQLAQRYINERGPMDAVWEERLKAQLTTTPVEVVGVLQAKPRSLREILSWQPGSHVTLEATPESMVEVIYGGMPAWSGLMGRKGDNVALSLERKIMNESL